MAVVNLVVAPSVRQPDRWHDSSGRETSLPYPIPFWKKSGDLVLQHKDDNTTVVFQLTRSLWTRDREVLEAWESAEVQRWIKETGRVVMSESQAYGDERSMPDSVRGAVGRSPAEGLYAFRNGKLLDHDRQFSSADQLLTWLKAVDSGDVPLAFARERAGVRTNESQLAVRLVLAHRLEQRGLLEEAADEYTWVVEQAYSQLAAEPPRDAAHPRAGAPARPVELWELNQYQAFSKAAELGPRFPATMSRLESLRDRLCDLASGPSGDQSAHIALQVAILVPNVDRINSLQDVLGKTDSGRLTLAREMPNVVVSLARAGKWADAGKVVRDPQSSIKLHMSKLGIMERLSDSPRPLEEASKQFYRQTELESAMAAGTVYAALLAADRTAEAAAAARTAFGIRDSPTIRAAFVSVCLSAGQARSEHRAWAEEGMKSWLFEPESGKPPPAKSLVDLVDEAIESTKR